ncbi:MAG: hypothetical protein JWQ35_2395, partial [Bacteriovoracaceae bacterium]|nr:hypothetical protein [Bacteriovoracaceae bacterium]
MSRIIVSSLFIFTAFVVSATESLKSGKLSVTECLQKAFPVQ